MEREVGSYFFVGNWMGEKKLFGGLRL
jgi:hypothetical protein